jgi:hypothetical protein
MGRKPGGYNASAVITKQDHDMVQSSAGINRADVSAAILQVSYNMFVMNMQVAVKPLCVDQDGD